MVECRRCHTSYEGRPAFCGVCGAKMPGAESLMGPPADPLIGLIIDNRYRLVDLIGRGGMGAVYRAEHVKMGKIMAMKILHGELAQDHDLARRFAREAETVSRLSHSNTVSVFDFGSDKGMMYLVMEYIDGCDLSELLRRDGPLPFRRCAGILMQVCAALNEAHSKGIIHRDLKPENILVGRRDEREDFVKVLDFGLAKLRDIQRTKITKQGSLVGTPYYMAPEHIRGEGVAPQSDIYSLGAVMFKLLTGEPPFTAQTPMGIISKHLTEEPPLPSASAPDLDIPECADRICIKAMSKAKTDRYASANEMRDALAKALKVSEATDSKASREAKRPSWRLRGPEETAPDKRVPDKTVLDKRGQGGIEGDGGPSPPPRGNFNATEPMRVLARSVSVGGREIDIGTKSDFFHYSKKTRRRRTVVAILVFIALLIVAGIGGFYLYKRAYPSIRMLSEMEPNDAEALANPIALQVTVGGSVGSAADPIDWFVIPASQIVRIVQISSSASLDVALFIRVKGSGAAYDVNRLGQGQGEGALLPEGAGPTLIGVASVRADGVAGTYALLAR